VRKSILLLRLRSGTRILCADTEARLLPVGSCSRKYNTFYLRMGILAIPGSAHMPPSPADLKLCNSLTAKDLLKSKIIVPIKKVAFLYGIS
jgi:hypothetical protein